MSAPGKRHAQRLLLVILVAIVSLFIFGRRIGAQSTPLAPPSQITVAMYELRENGGRTDTRCIENGMRSPRWGCTAYCGTQYTHCTDPAVHPPPVPKPIGQSGWVYPFSSNQVTVNIDGTANYDGYTYNRYLRDVVAQETNPEAFHAKAVHAQTIAARTYAYYHANAAEERVINNSASYQVYVPFRYDSRKRYYGDYRSVVEAAMQDQIYLVPFSSPPLYVLAQYFDDRPASTLSGSTANLVAVADPISQSNCGSSANGHGYGLSQKGASRWARGNPQYNVNIPGACPLR